MRLSAVDMVEAMNHPLTGICRRVSPSCAGLILCLLLLVVPAPAARAVGAPAGSINSTYGIRGHAETPAGFTALAAAASTSGAYVVGTLAGKYRVARVSAAGTFKSWVSVDGVADLATVDKGIRVVMALDETGGAFVAISGPTSGALFHVTPDSGSRFGPGTNGSAGVTDIRALAVDRTHRRLVVGWKVGSEPPSIGAFDLATDAPAANFGTGGIALIGTVSGQTYELAVDPAGRVVVLYYLTGNYQFRYGVARLSDSGAIEEGYGFVQDSRSLCSYDPIDDVHAMAIAGDGSVLVAMQTTFVGMRFDRFESGLGKIARLDLTGKGELCSGYYGTRYSAPVSRFVSDGSSGLIGVGSVHYDGIGAVPYLMRFDEHGLLDQSWARKGTAASIPQLASSSAAVESDAVAVSDGFVWRVRVAGAKSISPRVIIEAPRSVCRSGVPCVSRFPSKRIVRWRIPGGQPNDVVQLWSETRRTGPLLASSSYLFAERDKCAYLRTVSAIGQGSPWVHACAPTPHFASAARHRSGWTRITGLDFVGGSALTSTTRGAITRLPVATMDMAIIVTKCPSCGSILVTSADGDYRRVFSMRAARVEHRQLLMVHHISRSPLRITTRSNSRVVMEGWLTWPEASRDCEDPFRVDDGAPGWGCPSDT